MATRLELLQQRKAKLERDIAREVHKAKTAQRRLEDRQLEQMLQAGESPDSLTYAGQSFADWLTRPDERALFSLPSLGSQEPSRQE